LLISFIVGHKRSAYIELNIPIIIISWANLVYTAQKIFLNLDNNLLIYRL